MPVCWCELIPFERLRKWRRNVSEASPYLWPIFISMMLTQIAWVGVYQCSDKNNVLKKTRLFGGDGSLSESNDSMKPDSVVEDAKPKTLEVYITESLQLVGLMVVYSVIGFLIKWFASKFREGKLSYNWFFALHMSSYCASTVVRDATNLLEIDPSAKQLIAGSCSLVYFCGAVLAFFTDVFPARVTKYFGLTNQVFLSIVVLTLLPGGSFWTIAISIFFFVGLAFCISDRLGGFSHHDPQEPDPADMEDRKTENRRFKIYEVEVRQTPYGYEQGQIETTQSNKCIAEEAGEIFYGEIRFCSILVGQSMTFGIIPGVITACCVLIGVVFSVNVKNRKKQERPSDYSVLFGFCGHFGALIVQYALNFLLNTTA